MESTTIVDAALDLLQRTPVEETEQNVKDISKILSFNHDALEEFTNLADVPLHSTFDPSPCNNINTNTNININDGTSNQRNKKYIQSEHNREGDSYRSPWTNEYYPPLSSTSSVPSSSLSPSISNDDDAAAVAVGLRPSSSLRMLEIQANEVFESYKQLYYGKNDNTVQDESNEIVSSVYFWDKDRGGGSVGGDDIFRKRGFGGCFLIKKNLDVPGLQKGYWNSIHHVDFGPIVSGRSKYTLSTTILLSVDIFVTNVAKGEKKSATGKQSINIGSSLSKESEKILPIANPTDHIVNIGKMIEDVEIELRSNMDNLYIQKTKEIIDAIRPSPSSLSFHGGGGRFTTSSGGRRSGNVSGRGSGIGGLMVGGGIGLPSATQNEMNAVLMARFKKSNS
mmetsp:Transcript_2315/g.2798  ORF Transcript_2315/g.2798 Transcript_2315/m.2798 type:complete len:394 (-) Transcript_2315:139-1320(-)|eukprot:CAMPEP_0203662600 /NCGR_PEP_ID=MMETSP0090-20130426/513_1 /ASSEMBLY_ACC=CAM_ASM_001088 /TAXON_ID=426623 /ORGANISM="Chaetoceros affinis, Strain CCMP159" /LENGTH=393 /DNA_ID=CAMNT_0050525413 /DNA_START=101 /DNA_END=1282 /DNA_ORIENTATION=+